MGLVLLTGCTRVDLLDRLGQADITTESTTPVGEAQISVAGERRRGLRTDPTTTVRFAGLELARGAELRFGIGVDDTAWQQEGDGVLFQVLASIAGVKTVIFSRYVDPKNHATDRQWIDARVPLDPFLPTQDDPVVNAALVLKTSPGMRGNAVADYAGWSTPQITYPRSRPPTDPRPNVILISLDTLRADHVGVYGHGRSNTPHLDAWANSAAVFSQAVAPANSTLETHMSVLTGLPPDVHQLRALQSHHRSKSITPLDPRRVTLAEMLQGAGYHTVGFAHSCFWLDQRFGFADGFNVYSTTPHNAAQRNQEEVFPWLERNRDRRFFLFLHYYDIHSDWEKLPYDVPRPFSERFLPPSSTTFSGCGDGVCATQYLAHLDATKRPLADEDLGYIRRLYEAGIAFTDEQIGQLLDKLKTLGLYDRTLIIVMSDHGEEFREHGKFLHTQLYEELVRVPLVISYPPLIARGQRIDARTSLLDLTATVLDAAGIQPDPAMQGRSLLPVLRGDQPVLASIVSSGLGRYAIHDGQWKLIYAPSEGRQSLYDLNADPGEQQDQAQVRPEVAADIAAKLTAWISENQRNAVTFPAAAAGPAREAITPNAGELERLRNLGYIP